MLRKGVRMWEAALPLSVSEKASLMRGHLGYRSECSGEGDSHCGCAGEEHPMQREQQVQSLEKGTKDCWLRRWEGRTLLLVVVRPPCWKSDI